MKIENGNCISATEDDVRAKDLQYLDPISGFGLVRLYEVNGQFYSTSKNKHFHPVAMGIPSKYWCQAKDTCVGYYWWNACDGIMKEYEYRDHKYKGGLRNTEGDHAQAWFSSIQAEV